MHQINPRALQFTALLLASTLPAQSQASLIKKWEAKQQQAWFKDGGWTPDFAAAKARAAKEGKIILAYFSRSYAP